MDCSAAGYIFSHLFPPAGGCWAWGVDSGLFPWTPLIFLPLDSLQVHFTHPDKHSCQGAKEFC